MGDDVDEIEEGGKKGKGKLIILIVVAVLLLLIGGGGAAAYFLGFLDPLLGIEEEVEMQQMIDESGELVFDDDGNPVMIPLIEPEDDAEEEAFESMVDEEGNPIGPAYVDLREFLIDWEAGGKRLAYLKLTVALELVNEGDRLTVEGMMDPIHDDITGWLREQRPDDMVGAEGLFRLREEILIRANRTTDPVAIRDVLVRSMLIQ